MTATETAFVVLTASTAGRYGGEPITRTFTGDVAATLTPREMYQEALAALFDPDRRSDLVVVVHFSIHPNSPAA